MRGCRPSPPSLAQASTAPSMSRWRCWCGDRHEGGVADFKAAILSGQRGTPGLVGQGRARPRRGG